MKTFALLAAAAVAIAAAAPAAAQSVNTNAYKATLDYAGCLLGERGAEVRAFLAATPESAEAKAAEARVGAAGSTCAVGEARTGTKVLRGALAERSYLATYAAPPAATVGTVPFEASGESDLVDYDISRCTAMRDPVGADAMVRSGLRSPEEKAAIQRLMPVMGSCVMKGGKIGFDRERMRGLLAEGLLRIRATPAGTP